MCPTKQTANQILQGITTDLFLIKEKITDMQYKLLLDKCKLLYERIEKDKSTTLQLYKRYDKLRDQYIKQGVAFIDMYTDCHMTEQEEDSLITFVSSD